MLLFNPSSAIFLLMLENRTAAPVRLDRIVLRAFHGRNAWSQPLDLKILKFEHEGIWEAFGLTDNSVPPYALSIFGVSSQLMGSRIADAKKLQFVAIEGDKPAWTYSIGTGWLRSSIRWAIRDGSISPPSKGST